MMGVQSPEGVTQYFLLKLKNVLTAQECDATKMSNEQKLGSKNVFL